MRISVWSSDVGSSDLDICDHPFLPAENMFVALASNDPLVHLSGTLNTLAVAPTKIANDIRLLGSGPRACRREIDLPAYETGTSLERNSVEQATSVSVHGAMVC